MLQSNTDISRPNAAGTSMRPQIASRSWTTSTQQSLILPPSLILPTTKLTRVLRGVIIGLIVAGFLIVYWYIWAIGTYKWSLERLGLLMLNKYKTTPDLPDISKDNYYNYSNVAIAADKSYATCDIQIKSTISQKILITIPVHYTIVTTPDVSGVPPVECGFINFKCISV
jgi:hypothetical protein